MSSAVRRSVPGHVLALLCVTGPCVASQSQPTAALSFTPDDLWRFIEVAVKAELQPLVARLEATGSRLDSKIDKLDSRVHALTIRVYTQDSPSDSSATRLDGLEHQMEALMAKLNSLQSQLAAQTTRLDSQQTRLDDQVTVTSGQEPRLKNLTAALEDQQTRLANQSSKLDSLQSQLAGHAARLHRQAQLNEEVSRMDSQSSQLLRLLTRQQSVRAQVDRLSTELETTQSRSDEPELPRDCSELPPGASSGIHLTQPSASQAAPVSAFCDLDTDGGRWTVFQRRADIEPRRNFTLGWAAYRDGFGELDAEFWWGLRHLWTLTSSQDRQFDLRIDLEDFDGEKRHAVYQEFRISAEADNFRLTATNYTGDAGNGLRADIGQPFSTVDKDNDNNDGQNCARKYHGAWWFKDCFESHLNGRYLSGSNWGQSGVAWPKWRSWYSLKNTEMKIRPT